MLMVPDGTLTITAAKFINNMGFTYNGTLSSSTEYNGLIFLIAIGVPVLLYLNLLIFIVSFTDFQYIRPKKKTVTWYAYFYYLSY